MATPPTVQVMTTDTLHLSAAVAAAQPARIQLSPADWLLSRYFSLAALYFYDASAWLGGREASAAPDEFMPAARLGAALQRMLDAYPLLAGRFVMTADGCPEIDMQGEKEGVEGRGGITFRTASTAAALADLPLSPQRYVAPSCLPASLELVPAFDFASALSDPPLQVQITRFSCGGVCLGVRMHHWIGDAETFFGLVNDWAELYRKGAGAEASGAAPELDVPPSHDRAFVSTLLTRSELDDWRPDSYEVPQQVPAVAVGTYDVGRGSSADVPDTARVFRFEADELAAIKTAATAPVEVSGVEWVSTFEALSAHLHQCVWNARFGDDSAAAGSSRPDQVTLTMATNFRKRVPGTPAHYVGNCNIMSPLTHSGPDELSRLASDLPWLAGQVHVALTWLDRELVGRTLAWTAAQKDKTAIQAKIDMAQGLAVTQWNKQPVYNGAVFETTVEGKPIEPVRVCLPFLKGFNGLAVLMATESSAGDAIDVVLGLKEETMQRLEADPRWRRFRNSEAQASS